MVEMMPPHLSNRRWCLIAVVLILEFRTARTLTSSFSSSRCPGGCCASAAEVDLSHAGPRLPSPLCPAMSTAAKAGIEIKDTGQYGFGAFAGNQIKEGDCPGDYEGDVLTARDVSARYNGDPHGVATLKDTMWFKARQDKKVSTTGEYLFAISSSLGAEPDIFIDAEDPWRSNWCRFINHAPEPECNLRCRSLAADMHGNPRIWFVALRDIEAGEELLYDYGDNYWGELYKD